MIYLKLFFTFFKIGLFTFGGGYAMIPIVKEAVIQNAWLTEGEFLNFVAVSESTPGPIAVNMATFVGSEKGGILGSALATLGVVLPSFIIILIISALIKNLLKYAGVNAFLCGVRPCIVALILTAAITLGAQTFFGFKNIKSNFDFNYKGLIIFAVCSIIALLYKKLRKKKFSPILLIIISAVLGIVIYSI